MLRAAATEAQTGIADIISLMRTFATLRTSGVPYGIDLDHDVQQALASTHLRLFEYTSVVIRSYSIFERAVSRLAEGWLTWCLKCFPSAVLENEQCRGAYEAGLAEILRRRGEVRFSDLDLFELTRGHRLFSTDRSPPLAISIEPYLAVLPNFKIDQVVTLFVNVGLGNPTQWLSACPELARLRDESGISYSEALKNIVEFRNEVAHGNPDPDQIIGVNELTSRLEHLSSVVNSLHEYVAASAISRTESSSSAEALLGQVTHRWMTAGAFELTTACKAVAVGEKVCVVTEGEIFVDSIGSLQLDGLPHTGWAGAPGVPLGVVTKRMPKESARLFRLSAIRDNGFIFD